MSLHPETLISEVTVFRDGARITRTGKLDLEPGPHRVMIRGITQFAQQDSFRVKGRGPAKIASIDVATHTEVYDPPSDVKPLRDKLRKLRMKEAEILDDIATYTERQTQVTGMMTEFSEIFGLVYAIGESKIEQLETMDSKSVEMYLKVREKIHGLELDLRKTRDEIQVIQTEVNKVQGLRRTEKTYQVEIALEVNKKAPIEVDVIYHSSYANWEPSYDIDLHPGEAKVRRMAQVQNRSLENWKNVKMTISTASARPVRAIEGTPLILRAYEPELEKRRMASRSSMKMVGGAKAAAPGAPPMSAPMPPDMAKPVMEEEFAEVAEAASGISVYELPKRVTVPADGERHPMTLTEESLESKSVHYWYADGMAEVVAQDEVKNGNTVLLPGNAKIYAEGDYIGESELSMTSPRETFKLGTRIAHDVKASKTMVDRESAKAGIARGKLRSSYSYRIDLENYSKKEIEIKVVDRVPHSLNPAIEVKINWEKIGVDKYELGVMEWEFKIGPGKKRSIEYDYEVLWERGVTISPPLP